MKMRCKKCGAEYNGKRSSYRRFGNSEPEEFSYAVDQNGGQLTQCPACGTDINPNMVLGCKPEYMTPPNLEVVVEVGGTGGCLHPRSACPGLPAW